MEEFEMYFRLGFTHISDFAGFDHILFLLALTAVFKLNEWKKVLVLVTAFTIGHSLTLVLSAMDFLPFKASVVEFGIALTILLTALNNLFFFRENQGPWKRYLMALGFGFVHGMGFAGFFKSLLGMGDSFLSRLFFFNVGIELGQISIVSCILMLGFVAMEFLKIPQKWWRISLSVLAAIVAVVMMVQRIVG